MSKVFVAVLASLGLSACAGVGKSPVAVSSPQMCMPCTNPCFPDQSCGAVAKAAPAPAPAPAPAATPTFSPAPGSYVGAKQVALSSATPGATIHYTTDGTAPTAASPVYTGPIEVTKNTTIRAIALAPGAPESFPSAGGFAITEPPPAPPPTPAPTPAPAPASARVVVTEKKIELKEKIFFDTGKATIKPESHSLLDETARVLVSHPQVKRVVIEGHTDNRGAPAVNKKLSEERAKAVREYLVGKGVAADRLDAKGFGQTQPVADNKTAKGRDTNRRVEFSIVQ